jgi:peptidoglycan/LPS O-acetylase OafA/YrhL
MPSFTLPTFRWQARGSLSDHPLQSLTIAGLRGLAALQVAAAHLRAEVYPGLRTIEEPSLAYLGFAFLTGFAHQAVVVFFLISGWLVGGSLLNRLGQPRALANYAIDRLTRLWTVLIPTLATILVIGLLIGSALPGPIDVSASNEFSAASFAGNLLGLQTVAVPNYGGNYALWSLAYETWYYIQFPLLALVLLGHGRLRRLACAAALLLLAATLPEMITLYFLVWLLGAAFSRIQFVCGNGWRALLLLASLGLFTYYRLNGSNDDLVLASFVQDVICSLPLLLLLASLLDRVDTARRSFVHASKVANFFSEFSFTLYVIHVPLIGLMRHLGRQHYGRDQLNPALITDFLWYCALLLLLVATAYGFYLLFERHTFRVRRALKSLLLEPRTKRVRVAALSPD